MDSNDLEKKAFTALKTVMDSYAPISNKTWKELRAFCEFRALPTDYILYPFGEVPKSFSFVYSGLFRLCIYDNKGNDYNKNFFDRGDFPGSMPALLTSSPSQYMIESLEPSLIITIDFAAYRQLLLEADDLKCFHIFYLEKNWLLEKDSREVEIIQRNSSERYQLFMEKHPSISSRIPQYHIASHLGITPTQLSRIRKKY